MTDLNTADATSQPGIAPCGCVDTSAQQDRHQHTCLIRQTIAHTDQYLAADKNIRNRVHLLVDLTVSGPMWLDEQVLPDGTVLMLRAPLPLVDVGLWQRQGSRLVAISADAYSASIERCRDDDCGICRTCRSYRHHNEQRVAAVSSTLAGLTVALAELDKALADVQTVRDRWEDIATWDTGEDLDMSVEDTKDGQRDVENALRAIEDAQHALRGTRRITSAHLDTLHFALRYTDNDD